MSIPIVLCARLGLCIFIVGQKCWCAFIGIVYLHALYSTVVQMTMCGDSRLVVVLVVLLSSSLPSTLADEHSHSVSTDCTALLIFMQPY